MGVTAHSLNYLKMFLSKSLMAVLAIMAIMLLQEANSVHGPMGPPPWRGETWRPQSQFGQGYPPRRGPTWMPTRRPQWNPWRVGQYNRPTVPSPWPYGGDPETFNRFPYPFMWMSKK